MNKTDKDINNAEAEKKIIFPSRQSVSRLAALQVIYQIEFAKNLGEEVSISDALDNVRDNFIKTTYRIKNTDRLINQKFIEELVNNSGMAKEILKKEIENLLKEDYTWELLSRDLQIILQLATYELKFVKDTPAKVIINEYTDIAASLLKKKQVNFINGILNNLAKKVRSEEI